MDVLNLNVTEGSMTQTDVVGPTRGGLPSAEPFDAKAFLDRLDRLHDRMPTTEPVVEAMRRNARY